VNRQLPLLASDVHGPLPAKTWQRGTVFTRDGVALHFGAAEEFYGAWPTPICIVSDGPYGVGGFPGDLQTPDGLAAWYRPHIRRWSECATPETTLWFWNTEIGWATVHPELIGHRWEYRSCHIWNKGLGHVAGKANSLTLRKFPVVTEVCVQYVRPTIFMVDGRPLPMQEWLRREWARTGLPFRLSNEACGVADAATRKYLAGDHVWYCPPPDMFDRLVRYANEHGDPAGRPYFGLDGGSPILAAEWRRLRAKFHCEVGINNVWTEPPLRGAERLKRSGSRCLHTNQKPLRLLDIAIRASTDEGDVVWEPFGGLCPAAVSAHRLGRRCVSAEIVEEFVAAAAERLATYDAIRAVRPAIVSMGRSAIVQTGGQDVRRPARRANGAPTV